MTARWLTAVAVAGALAVGAGCTHAQSSRVRFGGEIAALGGIGGLITSAALTGVTDDARPFVTVFSVVSALGIISYAIAELSDPVGHVAEETLEQRHHRWAKILTERAAGAAREGRCARVRRLRVRVQTYDREVHDFVFLRDPEIMKCLQPGDGEPQRPAPEGPRTEGAPPEGPPRPSEPTPPGS